MRFISRGFINYGIDLWALDETGTPSQHEDARPIAAAPVTATPKHIPAPFERPMTGEFVTTTAWTMQRK